MPKTAYLIDSIGFMFTKCQNRKSFIYNKLRDFRESLAWYNTGPRHGVRVCLCRAGWLAIAVRTRGGVLAGEAGLLRALFPMP